MKRTRILAIAAILAPLFALPALGGAPVASLPAAQGSFSAPVQTVASSAKTLSSSTAVLALGSRSGIASGWGFTNNSAGDVWVLETRPGEYSQASPPSITIIQAAGIHVYAGDSYYWGSRTADVWMFSTVDGAVVYPREIAL